jgi:uncharacterized protein (DUF1697 family)
MPVTYAALMRGINVGGKNKLPMKDLAALFADAGCSDVRTYIQSGNVVFKASERVAAGLPAVIAKRITDGFGYQTPVVLRSAGQLAAVAAGNPFLERGLPEEMLHVLFLADVPEKLAVAGLDAERSPGDTFIVHGGEVFLHLPNGMGRTKLTNAYFDSKLATVSTARNWRTVLKLAEMTAG